MGNTARTVGSDFAGRIAVASQVPAFANLQPGVRVAGFLQGACSVNDQTGAFAEYLTVSWDLVWRIPASISVDEAAGVSLVALTAAQRIWYRMGLTVPFPYDREAVLKENPERQQSHTRDEDAAETLIVLIYSASTSVGLYAAQIARASAKAAGKKIKLFGTASKARWGILRAEPYFYDHQIEYRDPTWSSQIMGISDSVGIHYAYNGLSEGASVAHVASTLAKYGKMAIVRSREGGAWRGDNLPIEPVYGAVWEGLGEEVQHQGIIVAKSPAARDSAVAFYTWLSEAVGSEINPVPVRVMPGGLEKVVEDGFALLGAGGMGDRQINRKEEWMKPISAEKLVYRLETSIRD